MNILFYLLPKCDCLYIEEDDTLRQAMEKMEARRYSAVPLLSKDGRYLGTITEGDLLWSLKDDFDLSLHEAENLSISVIRRHRDYVPISIRATMEEISDLSLRQNFVPVSDDEDKFIGIITRQEIIKYLRHLKEDNAGS